MNTFVKNNSLLIAQKFLNPSNIEGIVGWWDASLESSVSTVSSGVSQWRDISGNNAHLNQALSINRPRYTSTINNLRTITFDGSNDFLQGSWANYQGSEHTLLGIFRWNGGGGGSDGRRFIMEGSNSDNTAWQPSVAVAAGASPVNMNFVHGFQSNPDSMFLTTTDNLVTSNTVTMFTANRYWTGSIYIMDVRINKIFCGTRDSLYPSSNTVNKLVVGSHRSANNRWFAGDICELIIINRSLNRFEIIGVENFLSNKWNI